MTITIYSVFFFVIHTLLQRRQKDHCLYHHYDVLILLELSRWQRHTER